MPGPVLLFYTPAPAPFASRLMQMCAVQGIRLRATEDLTSPLSSLAQGVQPEQAPGKGEALPEPLMVFCHFSDRQLDRALMALRKGKVSCLKAVLTPANAGWSLETLYGELCRERSQLGGAHSSQK